MQELGDAVLSDMICIHLSILPIERSPESEQAHRERAWGIWRQTGSAICLSIDCSPCLKKLGESKAALYLGKAIQPSLPGWSARERERGPDPENTPHIKVHDRCGQMARKQGKLEYAPM